MRAAAAALLLALCLPQLASAEDGKLKAPVIAVVDTEKILEESTAGQSIQKQVEIERAKFADQQRAYEEELRKTASDLQRQSAVMAPEAMKAERQKFDARATNIRQELTDRGQVLEKSFNDALKQVVDTMKDIVAQISKERGIDLVLPRRDILVLTDLSLDLTDVVEQRLNKKLPTLMVQIPKPTISPAEAPASAATK